MAVYEQRFAAALSLDRQHQSITEFCNRASANLNILDFLQTSLFTKTVIYSDRNYTSNYKEIMTQMSWFY